MGSGALSRAPSGVRDPLDVPVPHLLVPDLQRPAPADRYQCLGATI